MVRLTRIYTRTGDGGSTRLSDMSLVRKTDPRLEAYGDVDEANSALGVALATEQLPEGVATLLRTLQNEMFDLGADLSNPLRPDPTWEPLRITQDYIDRLEDWCDEYSDPLPALTSFILPGGSLAAAHLHVARTVARRAERAAWAAVELYGVEAVTEEAGAGGINALAVTYLNRLSDLLFIVIRVVNGREGDVLWVPGGQRNQVSRADFESGRRRRRRPQAVEDEQA
ncbi:cob(I)yrinic acid a,c-diamide adenosyltransferase [uncultured Friedmanniella sp.]|uniref:cob(I)yrinic acid a,c-diamide adenosyltransferase n=1 Tax=uncultured Friedmanniella sp. TaxID=335381 RepID=UPI0035CAE589